MQSVVVGIGPEGGCGSYDAPVEVRFETSEPARICYTTNGRRPTLTSPPTTPRGSARAAG
ncbi:MAG: hypothetical protein GEU88_16680 [Solirubrobacterales bacterium]|nr:hypothetical protein [Solirubrobacterales bacterium]